jgi:hypothetical protein
MKKRPAWSSGLLALVLLPVFAAFCQHAAHRSPPPEAIDLRVASTNVPMELFGGRPVVAVLVNGKGPFPYILDTGSTATVVTEALAHELGLPDKGHANAGRPGTTAPVPAMVTRIEKLELGQAAISGIFAVSMDLSAMWTGNGTPRGILSTASLTGLLVTLDYPANRVEVSRGELPAADGKSIFQWNADEALPLVPLVLNGMEVGVHVDSGSPSGINLPKRYAETLTLTGKPEKVHNGKTADGEYPVYIASLKGSASLGQYKIQDQPIHFMEGPTFGTIGDELLKRFSVTIDSKNRRIRLKQ